MVDTSKMENTNDLVDLKDKLWQSIRLLLSSTSTHDYHFILYLLTLQRKGILDTVTFLDLENIKQYIGLAVQDYKDEGESRLKFLFEEYEHILRDVDYLIVYKIVELFRSVDQTILKKNFSEIFDDLLFKILKSQAPLSNESILAPEVSRFVCSLAQLSLPKFVYNPFAGLASFGVLLPKDTFYLGQELKIQTWLIARLRLMAYDREYSVMICGDSSERWQNFTIPGKLPGKAVNKEDYQFDLIVSNPPFGQKLLNPLSGRFGNISNIEHFVIEKGLENLKNDGTLIVVLSQSFLSRSGTDYSLRRYLIEGDFLEMVISIPGGLSMNTRAPFSILVIKKAKKEKGVVRFIDATKFVESLPSRERRLNDLSLIEIVRNSIISDVLKTIPNEAIKAFDFNLSVPRYFQKEFEGVLLSDILSPISSSRNMSSTSDKLVRIRDLKDDRINYKLDVDILEENEAPRLTQLISETCLLLAARWKTLKPTFFEYKGIPVLISPDIIALNVDQSKVDVGFLINELHAGYINDQVDAFRVGSIIPSIRKDDLLSIKVQIPSIVEQRAKVKIALEAVAEEKKKALIYFNKIHGLKSELIEQNTYLRHTLAGPTSNLKGSIVNIKTILNNQVFNSMPYIANLKVSEEHDLTLGQYLEIVEKNINRINDAVSQQLNVLPAIESSPIAPIDIFSFLRNFVSEYTDRSHLDFAIEFDYDSEVLIDENGKIREVYINGNSDLLTDLLNNLIENARSHAFHQYNGVRSIKIVLLLDNDNDSKNEATILVSNTGKPFPLKVTQEDYIRKGYKNNLSAGEGYGGWLINRVVNRLNGSFLIVHEDGDNRKPADYLVTHFEFYFPIVEMN